MAIYKATVYETRVYKVEYEVEADSLKQAIEKAECGETFYESTCYQDSVIGREVKSCHES